eukprot:snap_masked-scaffold_13-processed-gene-9.29-mRNA-1 protein AED:1.00 eAED:1.00 QI:0/-1/0/0/-1/1/1/0/153
MTNTPTIVFAVVASNDIIYDLQLSPSVPEKIKFPSCINRLVSEKAEQHQLALFSSLDMIERYSHTNTNNFVKQVAEFGTNKIYAYITCANIKFILLFDNFKKQIVEERVKLFFMSVNDLFVKIQMNPFFHPEKILEVKGFDEKIQVLTSNYLV